MANALTLFDGGAVPAHVAAAQAEANITSKASVDALTFEGKVWQINLAGKKTKLLKADEDGEMQPVQIFTGIILDYTKQRGREYFKGAYDPKKPAVPDCWSEDGVTPEAAATNKQSSACASCPMAKKNSHVGSDGKGTVACSQFRKIALIPATKIGEFPPLRLRIKITSDWDGNNAEKNAATGWYAFQQYLDLLVSKGVSHTALLPTKIKFDTSVAYPKLLFSPGKNWVPADMWEDTIKPMANSDTVKELLAATYTPTAKTGTKALPADDDEETEVAAAIPAQAKPAKASNSLDGLSNAKLQPHVDAIKAAKAAPVEEDEEEAPAPVKPKAAKAAPVEEDEEEVVAAKPAKAAKAAKAAPVVEEEDEEEESAEQKAAAKRKAKADADAAAAAEVAAKAVAKAAKVKATVVEDEEEEEAPPKPAKVTAAPAAAKGGKAAAAAKPAINAPADVAGMLQEWDD